MGRTATCVWRMTPDLVLALDEHLGPPLDSYVNGAQTWLTDDGPGGATLEWRVHPVARYHVPSGLSHYDVWELAVSELTRGADAGALALGSETRALESLWDGIECFAAYEDEIEPAPLVAAASTVLERPPDASGLVDHERIGNAWEYASRAVSLFDMLLEELRTGATSA
jgi:hypothetical protein